jgi:hypothetical protein
VIDDASPDDTEHEDEQAGPPADDLLARLERLFEAPIGETEPAVRFDPEAQRP